MRVLPFFYLVVLISLPGPAIGYGAASTIAVSYAANSAVVCGISAGEVRQGIRCYKNGQIFRVEPYISYESISGGLGFFCGLNSGGSVLLCWETNEFLAKRLYYSREKRLRGLTVGNSHVCAIEEPTGLASCWRFKKSEVEQKFETITSGGGFSCGILKSNSSVLCWGTSEIAAELQRQFGNAKMERLAAGEFHACGMTKNGSLVCKGRNGGGGELDVPSHYPFAFSDLALGANHSCGILRNNGLVLCWGGGSERLQFLDSAVKNVSFESIVSGLDFACGLTTKNLSVICWGPGWPKGNVVPLPTIIPGPCIQTTCSCGLYPNSDSICAGSGNICKSCDVELPFPSLLPHSGPKPQGLHPVSSSSKAQIRRFWGFVIFGSLGAFAGLCALAYCTWRGVSSTMESSRQPGIVENASCLRSSSSIQVNESSSLKHAEIAEKMRFSVSELAAATSNFAMENKIGSGSFGSVYRGRLGNGCEVAIKRGESVSRKKKKKFQEKESAFRSEIMLLSRLHHRHLVELVGFCEEDEERLLVYEFMSNGSLYDHLHAKENPGKGSERLNSWKTRIKVALDAARGIEYLHNYAVPPIIHRDIKSSNILLDENMTAKVSDFGLSLISADSEDSMSGKAVGTVGYIDPEYYVLNILTAKSDVYGFGVVLLELLSGKKAVFRHEELGPTGIVEHIRPMISAGEIASILDERVGLPKENEVESVELLAYTAMHCVSLEGRDRPSISDIVANLEKAYLVMH
ncbi:putative serine/threonine-protein kinase-like protein CCR3 [Ipomoea triloba]|uniref:putative serine/threonine-protein kinase-like protein CCR3 n=1 Tax=Ipomoea triloba TaxID=35885 RepID=UPI00125E52D9|nr:putative serine/threonine-protein kinase-like protein CCR3 [Ipomoea triloba]